MVLNVTRFGPFFTRTISEGSGYAMIAIVLAIVLIACANNPAPVLTIQQDTRGQCQAYGVTVEADKTVDIHCAETARP